MKTVTRALIVALFVAGCGARTLLREPLDPSDAGDVTDTPPTNELPPLPDVPVVDRPPVPDITPGCADFQTLCSGRCVDTRSDNVNCGACGLACAESACVNGRCRTAPCTAPTSLCGVRCVDLSTDRSNCGGCNTVCAPGQTCTGGRCFSDCGGPGRTLCGSLCVDLSTDSANCGACGRACPFGAACSGGVCAPICAPGTIFCGGLCADPRSDSTNCGACGLVCPAGMTCQAGACGRAPPLTGVNFQITRLLPTNCVSVDHERATGDDRGGIAISRESVFYNGDMSVGRFDLDTLAVRPIGRVDDGLLSDLASGQVYSLRQMGMPVPMAGAATITDLALINGLTGAPLGMSQQLSTPIRLPGLSPVGIFSGYGRAVIFTGRRAYNIDLPSGVVTDLGSIDVSIVMASCETWASWGVAEFFEGAISLVYINGPNAIRRTRLPAGPTTDVATFRQLGDMCSFTVDPNRNRWYWHHEVSSQFASGAENLGYCDATFAR